ncbi:GGDEF domain-containing response regulator [Azospirillum rugosum]|uniref:diguanylate cyclase n=1 Tax=Azospirillum rugosum TaxID=416170 RepID=A0ABS4SFX8_9PROT|nr:diguanylate cyclase [Azospirillum rugosum]MBP2291468.1 diguanylate cyclase (GGDEF)-like protein/PAS domain S-box-containing protein [Azospirillum rugosum]MDQ0525256.1 diguanylate cyclase (GGDEF)-like protein/PAS domain S-box-containing protein [Azospirillum rugosum]
MDAHLPSTPTAILLVEDDDADAGLVIRTLRPYARRFTLTRATTLQEARAFLLRNACDVVLLDLSLPDSFGFDTVRRMRGDVPSLPLVVLTGLDDEDFALQALAAGTQDYLVKGQADGPLVWRAIQHAIARKRLEEQLRLSEERLAGIIELAQDAILTTDENLNITLFNPAAERLFGYSSEQIVGRPLWLLIPERLRGEHARAIADFAQSPVPTRAMTDRSEVTGVTFDGREFPAEVSIAKLQHPHGMLYTAVVRDISERKRVEAELRRMATTDPLTGLWNRRRFLELAEGELSRLRRYARPVSVLMLDIDHFKAINDTHGHAAGDEALCRLADRCRAELRETDHLGRLGGEEFAIVLPETGLGEAVEVAERLRLSLSDMPVRLGDTTLHMTVSIGVAACRDGDASIDRALGRADRALYAAKGGGRNRVVADAPEPLEAERAGAEAMALG